MKVRYDEREDILKIEFSDKPIKESDEDKSGIILDYDNEGNVVGMEILDASIRVSNPRLIEYGVSS